MRAAFIPVAVPGADLVDVVRRLDEMGLVGAAVDGHQLGLHDVVVARVVGDDDAAWVIHEPGTRHEALTLDGLTESLRERWTGSLVGAAVFGHHGLADPVLVSTALPRRSVAVTPRTELLLDGFVRRSGTTLHEAVVGDRLVVELTSGLALDLDVLVDALGAAKGRSVVLWKIGDHVALHAMRRGRHAAAHVWTARWTSFGHPDLDELRDPELDGDAEVFGEVLRLTSEQVEGLRAMMQRDLPDLAALADLLDLPPVVADVLEGRGRVADLAGAVRIDPRAEPTRPFGGRWRRNR